MKKFDIQKEIDKSMQFVMKKISEGRLLVDTLEREDNLFIYIKNGRYDFYEEDEKKSFNGILLLRENIEDLNKFKLELRKKSWNLNNNGFIILRYVNNDIDDIDLKGEEFQKFFKEEGFVDIESYILLTKDENEESSKKGLVVIGRWHEDLLKETPEYEAYSKNLVKSSKCGGCSKKSGGCSACSGGCCKK
ncbi:MULTISPECIES: hypothetical protein [Clostridium]|uniref:Uncharacterized protein n=1 Tax=Clostridium cibarium TaxID=2762247 RepID=A0ABR8PXW3_9CLOT|nr:MULTISPECIES: hypothetical protein [Clostridium]MBD7913007.1 hypothetical protein [Clostridium cibarium]